MLPPTEIEVSKSESFDKGAYIIQILKIENEPHRVKAIIIGPNNFRVDKDELMQSERFEFLDSNLDRTYMLHIRSLEAGSNNANSVEVEISRID